MARSCVECDCDTVFFHGQVGICGHCSHAVSQHTRYCFLAGCVETAEVGSSSCRLHADVLPFPRIDAADDPRDAIVNELHIIATSLHVLRTRPEAGTRDEDLQARLLREALRRLHGLIVNVAPACGHYEGMIDILKAMLHQRSDQDEATKKRPYILPNDDEPT